MDIVKTLQKGEKVLKTIKPSRKSFAGAYFWAVILLPLFPPASLILILYVELKRNATTYYITNKKIIHEFSFLSRQIKTVPFKKIQDIHFFQNFIERLFSVGSVGINTAGSDCVEIVFRGISEPIKIKKLIEKNI